MAFMEPLGLAEMSMVGLPYRSTYWVATWPFSIILAMISGRCHKAALAVGHGHGIQIVDLRLQHPGVLTEATRVVTYGTGAGRSG